MFGGNAVLDGKKVNAWMAGEMEDGPLHRGNVTVRDGVICSYRAPIAARMGKAAHDGEEPKPLVAVDTRRFSTTTNNHQYLVRHELYRQLPRPVFLATSLDMWREAGVRDLREVDLYDTFGEIEYWPHTHPNYALLNDGRRALLHGQERIKGNDWQYFLIEVRSWVTGIADAMQFILPKAVKDLLQAKEWEMRAEARGDEVHKVYPELTGGLLRQGDLWFLETTYQTKDLLDGPWGNLDRLRDLQALNLLPQEIGMPYMSRRVADVALGTSWGDQREALSTDPRGWSHQPTDLRRDCRFVHWYARGVVRHRQHPTVKLGDGKTWWRIEETPAQAWSSGSRAGGRVNYD